MANCDLCLREFSKPNALVIHRRFCGRTCSIELCGSPVKSRGWCRKHYLRWYKHGDPLTVQERTAWNKGQHGVPQPCSIEGCEQPLRGRGWCVRHYACWVRTGDPIARERVFRGADAVCVVDDCTQPHRSRGYCKSHYLTKWWYPHNPARLAGYGRQRNSRQRGNLRIPFSPDQLQQRLSMWPGCWMCGATPQAVDHVKPVAAGGPHCLSNLRPACTSCNSRKRDTWPLEATAWRT